MEAIRSVLVPIHREGHKFIAIFAVVTVGLFFLSDFLGAIGVILTLWCTYFFRDPDRFTPTRQGLIISPADGVVQMVENAVPPPELGMGDDPRPRVSVFMNVFNVHVNRAPADGEILAVEYRPGKFLNAALDKASTDNERMAVRMKMANGRELAFVQIAGLVARRILCELKPGQTVQAGERFGLIRFGSRVDVYLDDDMAPLVSVGQLCIAGETVIADGNSEEPQRDGAKR